MATTRDYLEYLNQKIDIAPVNSEEEYQAAGLIESLMQAHGLETRLQDFEAPGLGKLPYRICGIILFLGVFLSGFLGTRAALVGELLVLVCFVLLAIYFVGYADPLGKLGRPINSQNVIGVHRASGPLVTKGARPIVIVAHYDTPRENLLFAPPFDRFQIMLRRFAPQCVCVAAALSLMQLFGFVPAAFRHLLWVVAIVAALPQLLVGIAAIQERFATCTEGSNDNKSGVAAMLGVMAKVHPGDDEATGYGEAREQRDRELAERLAAAQVAEIEAAEAAEAIDIPEFDETLDSENAEAEVVSVADATLEPNVVFDADIEPIELVEDESLNVDAPEEDESAEISVLPMEETSFNEDIGEPLEQQVQPSVPQTIIRQETRVERIEGVRHGKDELERLHILPEDCEIVYIEPKSQVVTYEEHIEAVNGAGVQQGVIADVPYDEDYDEDAYYGFEDYEEGEGAEGGVAATLSGAWDGIKSFFLGLRERISGGIASRQTGAEEEGYAFDSRSFEADVEGVEAMEASDEASEQMDETQSDVIDFQSYVDEGQIVTVSDTPTASLDLAAEEDQLIDEVHAAVNETSENATSQGETTEATAPVVDIFPDEVPDPDGTLAFVPLGQLYDGSEVDEMGDTKDASGLETLAQDDTVNELNGSDVKPNPAPIDDPEWGRSNFQPQGSSVARRAVLFDLPDPLASTGASDPLRGSFDDSGVQPTAPAPAPEALPVMTLPTQQAPQKGGLRGLFGRKRKEQEQESMGSWLGVGDNFDAKSEGNAIGTWDNFNNTNSGDDSGDSWKGGAARRSDLRIVEDDDVRVQEELRDAVLSMGDDELLAHDIWFVALGGSHADQAGMRAFLEDNRRGIRGCFLVNLSCVGAGELTLLTREGMAGTRKADRRIVRLLTHIADDLHIDLVTARHDWEDTDATPAMRASLRSATICGTNPDGSFALSKVAQDEPDYVDPTQTTNVADMVAELIRRA